MRFKLVTSLLILTMLLCQVALASGGTSHWPGSNRDETPADLHEKSGFSAVFIIYIGDFPVQPAYLGLHHSTSLFSSGQPKDGSDPDASDGSTADSSWSRIKDLY
jgi:hypothetical protein